MSDVLQARSALPSAHLRWLLFILLAALTLRLLFIAFVNPDPRDEGRFDDTALWYYGARFLADGEGFVQPGEHTPTGMFPPGYLVALAAIFKLPGDDVAAARGLNLAASMVLIAGVYYLGSRLWGPLAGLIAAAIMAFFPSGIFFSTLVLRELVFAAATVVLLSLTVAWTMRSDVKPLFVFGLGLIAGTVALIRPEGFILALTVIVTWMIYHRSPGRVATYTALLVLGMAVLFAPWTIRNYLVFDQPLLLGTSGGPILYEAHQPESRGNGNWLLPLFLSTRFKDTPLPEKEVKLNSTGTSEAIDYAVHHIPREMELATHRFAGFYRGDGSHMVYFGSEVSGGRPELPQAWLDRWISIADCYYYVVLGVMLAGLPFWIRRFRREHSLLIAPIVMYSITWALLFVGHNRYHFPLLSLFAVVAAIGAAAAWERLRPRTTSGGATAS